MKENFTKRDIYIAERTKKADKVKSGAVGKLYGKKYSSKGHNKNRRRKKRVIKFGWFVKK